LSLATVLLQVGGFPIGPMVGSVADKDPMIISLNMISPRWDASKDPVSLLTGTLTISLETAKGASKLFVTSKQIGGRLIEPKSTASAKVQIMNI
jgi:hypothetical protein